MLKARTIANATRMSIAVFGRKRALYEAFRAANHRLYKVTGWKGRDIERSVTAFARTGDNLKYLITWARP